MESYEKIIQIIPTDNWVEVRWKNDGNTKATVEVYTVPIIGWALVERLVGADKKCAEYADFERDGLYYTRDVLPLHIDANSAIPTLGDDDFLLGVQHSSSGLQQWDKEAIEAWEYYAKDHPRA